MLYRHDTYVSMVRRDDNHNVTVYTNPLSF